MTPQERALTEAVADALAAERPTNAATAMGRQSIYVYGQCVGAVARAFQDSISGFEPVGFIARASAGPGLQFPSSSQ